MARVLQRSGFDVECCGRRAGGGGPHVAGRMPAGRRLGRGREGSRGRTCSRRPAAGRRRHRSF
ncbi:MAG: hypothetical protein MZV70_35185 [Desulfobacterales bacterium]|nr:hypothetical protein [Desulfobacterales bacterium]